jgi:membrane protein YqaA with SNARE-associated domain
LIHCQLVLRRSYDRFTEELFPLGREGFADSPWAVAILVINSFTESIFNPIPPDPLLIGMSVLNPNLALLYAALVTASSVIGALVGHWLGLRFGRPLVLKFVSQQKVDRVEGMFQRYGSWAVLVAAFTPYPTRYSLLLLECWRWSGTPL